MDKFEIEGDEVIERDVKATGNGAHAYLPEDVCPICRKDRKRSKSDGFGPMGADADWYAGCDTCRERVIFGNTPSAQPAWIE